MNIVYLHGANATPASFNFLKQNIGQKAILPHYKSADGFFNNLAQIHDQIKDLDDIFSWRTHLEAFTRSIWLTS
ncbi:hypothetical protein LP414_27455 [Polaromonas sp. P1(28)-13]|nr:hypothetical protein LP414_27455 [Polaromonas sp. P1(28)-13]